MYDLNDLYQEIILDHNAHPHHFGKIAAATHSAQGHNPLCGDEIELSVCIENGCIKDIGFVGQGCAISRASASLMSDAVSGQSLEKANCLFDQFHGFVAGDGENETMEESLGKIAALKGVRQFPARVKCATLAWHTLKAALESRKIVSTESAL